MGWAGVARLYGAVALDGDCGQYPRATPDLLQRAGTLALCAAVPGGCRSAVLAFYKAFCGKELADRAAGFLALDVWGWVWYLLGPSLFGATCSFSHRHIPGLRLVVPTPIMGGAFVSGRGAGCVGCPHEAAPGMESSVMSAGPGGLFENSR